MKKIFLFLSMLIVFGTMYSQRKISGQSGYMDLDLSVANYDNGIPNLTATVKLEEPSGNNLLDAEESAKVVISIKNSGTNAAFEVGVKAVLDNANNISMSQSVKQFPQIKPNETVTVSINLSANFNIQNTDRLLKISFTEYQGFIARPVNFKFQTQKYFEPKLVVVETGIEEMQGNKNNIIEKGELIKATVLVQNQGQGTATNLRATISGFLTGLIAINKSDYPLSKSLGTLSAGQTAKIQFVFSASWGYEGSDNLPLKIKLTEQKNKFGGTHDLGLKMSVVSLAALDMKQGGNYQQAVDIKNVSLTSLVNKDIPVNPQNKNRFALIIGNENYVANGGLSVDVPYAINDALIFSEYAKKTLGVPAENLIYLTNVRTTEMRNEISNFAELMAVDSKNREFFIYYAGHGFYDSADKAYMMPVDVKHTNISDAYKLADFYRKIGTYETKRTTVFLDACFSGGGRGNDGLVAGRTGIRRTAKASPVTGSVVVFAAAQGKQTSKPYDKEKHGLFTYYLLQKIKDTKGDISYGELARYLENNVKTKSRMIFKEEQTPNVQLSPNLIDTWTNWRLK